MAPAVGSRHRKARPDSAISRLWPWARKRKKPWTTTDAAEACTISARRCRAIVTALHDAGLIEQVSEAVGYSFSKGSTPRTWQVSPKSRHVDFIPIMVVDGARGIITGIRDSTAKNQ